MSRNLGRFLAILTALAAVHSRSNAEPPEKPITAADRDHWAFRPISKLLPPALTKNRTYRNPIDAFIAQGLGQNGLTPAPEASRSTLIRRLTIDLLGISPTPDEVESFLADHSPLAYDKLVHRLLASPHYGVRQAQHWLDLARYADTDGFEFDQARPNAWRYRDWVVTALNADLPYDRFLALQLAGDEIAPDDPSAFTATGFNRCYPDMVDLNDQGLRRQNALNDITETTGLVFLGLTIGCARCHDHKFDPIRQTDFYRLQAFFTPARFRDDYTLATPTRRKAHEQSLADWRAEVAKLQSQILRIEKPKRDQLAPGLPVGTRDDVIAVYNKADAERTPAEVSLLYDALRHDSRIKPNEWDKWLDQNGARLRADTLQHLTRLERSRPAPLPTARGLDDAGPNAPATYLLTRGEFTARGRKVEPTFPAVLSSADPKITPSSESTGRRKALAQWLTRPEHPLTARVIVNRLWQHHFGRGLVATPSDFGTMGEEPSHPELLDWLASRLIEENWSLKAIHELIVTSATYRQSSTATPQAQQTDPENLCLSHQNIQRLDGESIRDALLSAAGLMNPALGGPGIFPPLPPELTQLSSKGAIWPVSRNPADQNRRSLYVFVRRNLRYPFFEAFDRPDTNASCPKRPVTTIAPQALSLLNSPLSAQAANGVANRVIREAEPDDDSRIHRAYLLILSRNPDPAELELARRFLNSPDATLADFCLALLNLNEFIYVD